MPEKFHFVCLDPRKTKRRTVCDVLSPLGDIRWFKVAPMGTGHYAETNERVQIAYDAAKGQPTVPVARAAKKLLLRLQYQGARSFFEKNRHVVAVAWNGLNGTRRVFMDAARDAGACRLYFELCPFQGRITVDPCGVNFANGLPRTIQPYAEWNNQQLELVDWRTMQSRITARKPSGTQAQRDTAQPMTGPFVFVPLQVPGDSQLRLFGGAFKTVEATIGAIAQAARFLPDGWHMRVKEHPSARQSFDAVFSALAHPKLVRDNQTDTFAQVAASRAVVTVNSSVGLEAMFFDKPVVALGDCFWAIDGVAHHCPISEQLNQMMQAPEKLTFDPAARNAFLSFLTNVYYPSLPQGDEAMDPDEAAKIVKRLQGPDDLGFWAGDDRE